MSALYRYDKYLKKIMNMKIKDLEKILSVFLSESSAEIIITAKKSLITLETEHKLKFLEDVESKINNKDSASFFRNRSF